MPALETWQTLCHSINIQIHRQRNDLVSHCSRTMSDSIQAPFQQ